MKNNYLKRRILEISYKKKLSHIGSCLTAVDIIDEIYATKKLDEKFVLSSGHAGLALYVVLENEYIKIPGKKGDILAGKRAENIFDHHGVHPDRCTDCVIDCSSGSLGHGLGIAVGMALADRTKNVYCLISDGECAEGSILESLRIIDEQEIYNLRIFINNNGWAAFKRTNIPEYIWNSVEHVSQTNMDEWPSWLQGQQAHYVVMDEKMYKEALEVMK